MCVGWLWSKTCKTWFTFHANPPKEGGLVSWHITKSYITFHLFAEQHHKIILKSLSRVDDDCWLTIPSPGHFLRIFERGSCGVSADKLPPSQTHVYQAASLVEVCALLSLFWSYYSDYVFKYILCIIFICTTIGRIGIIRPISGSIAVKINIIHLYISIDSYCQC